MASLNHVCMWTEHGWKHVTAEEASILHPGGTVSAYSGLFMCELCGQYVILTDGYIRDRYFKHSASEANKNCPERTFGTSYYSSFTPQKYELPIRLILDSSGFRLELGLLRILEEILQKYSKESVIIQTDSSEQYKYSFERLNPDMITYLPVGNIPSASYSIYSANELSNFWPSNVRGISAEGSVFDGQTGRLLTTDADVQLGKKYYLLTRCFCCTTAGLSIKKCCEQQYRWSKWYVYEIEAKELSEEAAKFFLKLHYRLTDKPMKIVPIWPIHVETPHLININLNVMLLHITGNREVQPKVFPYTTFHTNKCPDSSRIIQVMCNDRQQVISAGNINVLEYFYIWRTALSETTLPVEVDVRDSMENLFEDGEQDTLPKDALLRITAPYDGTVILEKTGRVIEKIPLSAEKRITVDHLQFGMSVSILQGFDIVWKTEFVEKHFAENNRDTMLYQKLCSFAGNEMPVPHSFGAATMRLKHYPQTKKWITTAVHKGTASKAAIDCLKRYISKLVVQNKEQK